MKLFIVLLGCVFVSCQPPTCEEQEKTVRGIQFYIILTELPKGGNRIGTYIGLDSLGEYFKYKNERITFNRNAQKANIGDTLSKGLGTLNYQLRTNDTVWVFPYEDCCGWNENHFCVD